MLSPEKTATDEAVHDQDAPWNEEGGRHRTGGVRHRGFKRESSIIASGGDHGLADAQKMAELKVGSTLPSTTDRYRVAIKHVEPVIGSLRVPKNATIN